MKNVTLSIPEDLLRESREYAKRNGSSLNEYIRTLLKQAVRKQTSDTVEDLEQLSEKIKINTKSNSWNRSEIYDRKVFS